LTSSRKPYLQTESEAKFLLHFRDDRPPHEMKFALERELKTLFHPSENNEEQDETKWCVRATSTLVGASYEFLLCFEAALTSSHCYSFRVDVSWSGQDPSIVDYYQRTSVSWFELWTRELQAADPPIMNEADGQRYRQLCEEASVADEQFDSILSIQQAIISAMKNGACFRTSHKEGGTHIYWRGDRFVRSDYGENPEDWHFLTEELFFSMLFPFYRWEFVNPAGITTLTDIDAWRLIQSRLDR
jgi:hypothetical protein